jgi:hypothetical protein
MSSMCSILMDRRIVCGRMAISIIGHVPSTPPRIGDRWLISAFEPA